METINDQGNNKPYPGKVYVTLKEMVLQFARSFFNVMVHVWIKFHFNGSFLYTTFNRFIALPIKHKSQASIQRLSNTIFSRIPEKNKGSISDRELE
ncbi:hypothetical protein AM233_01955 [Bacillus sp. FJAT-22058]|nr:hypothetical protein AM233_01955 [Bacillus sp. FJAT-22058]